MFRTYRHLGQECRALVLRVKTEGFGFWLMTQDLGVQGLGFD